MIKSLEGISEEKIIDCLHEAFSDYSIPMKMPYNYWIKRWKAARIDYALSYGYFDGQEIVGFVLHGIDQRYGKKSFFNMGTGVIPSHRRQSIVQNLYETALLELKLNNCQLGLLEVIQDNEKAIRAYQKVGFKISENLISFKGPKEYKFSNNSAKLEKVEQYELSNYKEFKYHRLSWEHENQIIDSCSEEFECYEYVENNKLIGFLLFKKSNKTIVQFGVLDNDWLRYGNILFSMAFKVIPNFRVININDKDKFLIDFFESHGYEIFLKQYEMKLEF